MPRINKFTFCFRLGKCHHKYQVNATTNRTSSGNPFLSDFIPTPGNEAEEN